MIFLKKLFNCYMNFIGSHSPKKIGKRGRKKIEGLYNVKVNMEDATIAMIRYHI